MEVFAEETFLSDEDDYFSELKKLRIANRIAQKLLVKNTKLLNKDANPPNSAEVSSMNLSLFNVLA